MVYLFSDVGFALAVLLAICLAFGLHSGSMIERNGGRPNYRWIWAGHFCGAVAALLILTTPLHPMVGAGLGGVGYLGCALAGRRRRNGDPAHVRVSAGL